MKTKQEIIEYYFGPSFDSISVEDGFNIFLSMDEYAREHTLAFLKYWEQFRKDMSEPPMKVRLEGRELEQWDDMPETVYVQFLKSLAPEDKPAK